MSRQYRYDDTDKWKYAFGNGSDGDLVIGANTTFSAPNRGCSGSLASSTLTIDSAGFANGDLILIIQSKGSGAGNWELNKVQSGGGSTSLTLVHPLQNNYTDSGINQAQVVKLFQYKSVTIQAGATLSPNQWNGSQNGIVAFLCKNKTNILGAIDVRGKGFVKGVRNANQGGWGGNGGEGVGGTSATGGWNESTTSGTSPGSGAMGGASASGGTNAAGEYSGGNGGGGCDGKQGDEGAGGGGGGGYYFGGGGGGGGADSNGAGGNGGLSNAVTGGGGGGREVNGSGDGGNSGQAGSNGGGAGVSSGYTGAGGLSSDNRGSGGGGGGANASQSILSLTRMFFGGGGGAGGNFWKWTVGDYQNGGDGGDGSGIVLIISRQIDVSTGYIYCSGNTGGNPTGGRAGNGGGGAAGSVLLKTETATLGSTRVLAEGSNGGSGASVAGRGGQGSRGIIHLDYSKTYTGVTSPTVDASLDSSIKAPRAGGAFLQSFIMNG